MALKKYSIKHKYKIIEKVKFKQMYKSRVKKLSQFMQFIHNDDTILDVGAECFEYSPVDNFLEKNYPRKEKITGLTIYENTNSFRIRYPEVSIITYDGNVFPFEDNTFDIVYSNAVIEHVGCYKKQEKFLDEMIRVAKSGVYFTTPNKYFPIELHTVTIFIHWLPKPMFDWILIKIGKKSMTGDYMNLLSLSKLKRLLEKHISNCKYNITKNKILFIPVTFSVFISKNYKN